MVESGGLKTVERLRVPGFDPPLRQPFPTLTNSDFIGDSYVIVHIRHLGDCHGYAEAFGGSVLLTGRLMPISRNFTVFTELRTTAPVALAKRMALNHFGSYPFDRFAVC